MERWYLDFPQLVSLVVKQRGSADMAKLLGNAVELPAIITRLHLLQLEALLNRMRHDSYFNAEGITESRRTLAYFQAEQVIKLVPVDYDHALMLATQLARDRHAPEVAPTQILHPCLALLSNASHFLGHEPHARYFAGVLGLRVPPD